ncbi:transposase [Streptomyces sp. NPDC059851]|uniref:transposase n=1 Tax=Streptomyces sp. NPDC059851 TaxID=3346971 RepID=UPI00364BE080
MPCTPRASRTEPRAIHLRRRTTVLTDAGAVTLAVPRDRNGDFEPRSVPRTPAGSRGPTTGSSRSTRAG